jgi:dolichol-phosphate mannosyltransferase
MSRVLVGIPVFNERDTLARVYRRLRKNYSGDVLFVDDGSTDGSPELIAGLEGAALLRHRSNRGYGQTLIDIFAHALRGRYELLVTMDADDQHEADQVQQFLDADAAAGVDVLSGSRYLLELEENSPAPLERYTLNMEITALINEVTGFNLTDAFCGMKAYRTDALGRLRLEERGYAMPVELWIEAYAAGLTVRELPVKRIYVDRPRSFGPELDIREKRRSYYLRIFQRAIQRLRRCQDRSRSSRYSLSMS